MSWALRVAAPDYPDGIRLTANSSAAFGPRSKARAWWQNILGRQISVGEIVDSTKVLPRRCRVLLEFDEASGFMCVKDVMKPKVDVIRPEVAAPVVVEDDDDDIPA